MFTSSIMRITDLLWTFILFLKLQLNDTVLTVSDWVRPTCLCLQITPYTPKTFMDTINCCIHVTCPQARRCYKKWHVVLLALIAGSRRELYPEEIYKYESTSCRDWATNTTKSFVHLQSLPSQNVTPLFCAAFCSPKFYIWCPLFVCQHQLETIGNNNLP